MSKTPEKKPTPPDAWVAQTQLSIFVGGKMLHLTPAEVVPESLLNPEAFESMVRTKQIIRFKDYNGPVINCPVSAPRPLAVATVEKPLPPIIRDEHGMVQPDMNMGLPGDPPEFRIDRVRPAVPTYIKPGHSVEVRANAPRKDADGFTAPDWNPSRLANRAAPDASAGPEVSCVQCDRDFADFETLKVHESQAHRNESFHETHRHAH